jgi:hypothetical protein
MVLLEATRVPEEPYRVLLCVTAEVAGFSTDFTSIQRVCVCSNKRGSTSYTGFVYGIRGMLKREEKIEHAQHEYTLLGDRHRFVELN